MTARYDSSRNSWFEDSSPCTSRLVSIEELDQETELPPIKKKNSRRLFLLSFLSALVIVAAFASVSYLSRQGSLEKLGFAHDFTFSDLNGSTFQLSNLAGKVVIIDFIATWCSACRNQLFQDKAIVEKYGTKIIMISIDIDPTDSEHDLRALAQHFSYSTWLWARDTANIAHLYEVAVIPKTVVIDRDSYIRFEHTGLVDASDLMPKIDQLLD